jgi:hypothetical protein
MELLYAFVAISLLIITVVSSFLVKYAQFRILKLVYPKELSAIKSYFHFMMIFFVALPIRDLLWIYFPIHVRNRKLESKLNEREHLLKVLRNRNRFFWIVLITYAIVIFGWTYLDF